VNVTLLLCDAAAESNGKLFVLGGGWSLAAADTPINMALAILVAVPWDQTNKRFTIMAKLMTEDGAPVYANAQEVVAQGQLEVGRPPGVKPGSDLNTPLAMTFNGIAVPEGGYRWELWIDDSMIATAPFRTIKGGPQA
jgi:hypothetical protein